MNYEDGCGEQQSTVDSLNCCALLYSSGTSAVPLSHLCLSLAVMPCSVLFLLYCPQFIVSFIQIHLIHLRSFIYLPYSVL